MNRSSVLPFIVMLGIICGSISLNLGADEVTIQSKSHVVGHHSDQYESVGSEYFATNAEAEADIENLVSRMIEQNMHSITSDLSVLSMYAGRTTSLDSNTHSLVSLVLPGEETHRDVFRHVAAFTYFRNHFYSDLLQDVRQVPNLVDSGIINYGTPLAEEIYSIHHYKIKWRINPFLNKVDACAQSTVRVMSIMEDQGDSFTATQALNAGQVEAGYLRGIRLKSEENDADASVQYSSLVSVPAVSAHLSAGNTKWFSAPFTDAPGRLSVYRIPSTLVDQVGTVARVWSPLHALVMTVPTVGADTGRTVVLDKDVEHEIDWADAGRNGGVSFTILEPPKLSANPTTTLGLLTQDVAVTYDFSDLGFVADHATYSVTAGGGLSVSVSGTSMTITGIEIGVEKSLEITAKNASGEVSSTITANVTVGDSEE